MSEEEISYWKEKIPEVLKYIESNKKTKKWARKTKILIDSETLENCIRDIREYLPSKFETNDCDTEMYAIDKNRPSYPKEYIEKFFVKDTKGPAFVDLRPESRIKKPPKETEKIANPRRFLPKHFSAIKRTILNEYEPLILCIWEYRYKTIPLQEGKKETAVLLSEPRSPTAKDRRIAWSVCPMVSGDSRVRLDILGNVIGLDLPRFSLFAIEWDHLFPYSKGGRQKDGNLIALQYYANSLKSNKWFFLLDYGKLIAGATEDMFCCMLENAKEKFPEIKDHILWILQTDWYYDINSALSTLIECEKTEIDVLNGIFGEDAILKIENIVSICKKKGSNRLQALCETRSKIKEQNWKKFHEIIIRRMFDFKLTRSRKTKETQKD